MDKFLIILIVLISNSFANDGAFYAQGNNLIPINENEISLKKEILTIKKESIDKIEVTVYYELLNPNKDKKVIVGFEALSPYGDVEAAPRNGSHPYINDFTVELNDSILSYKIAHVSDSLYFKNGHINSIDLDTFGGSKNGNFVDFNYVYYFNANFKKGKNIIKHTYSYKPSGSVYYDYEINYKLTTATRWANKQIDDFTLIIDVGEFESINIKKTFFKNRNEWILNGIGKCIENPNKPFEFTGDNTIEFNIQKGYLIFNKKDFIPSGELFLFSLSSWIFNDFNILPFSYNVQNTIKVPENEFQVKVLKNLPFARRGYIFKNEELYNFYSKQDWYIPNQNYIPNIENLSDIEKEWLKKIE